MILSAPLSGSFVIVPHKKKQTATVSSGESPENQFATASEKFNARWNVMIERLIQYKEEHGEAELDWICMKSSGAL
jgi:hypothetical protein